MAPPINTADLALAELERATTTLGDIDPKESIALLERSIAAAAKEPRALIDDPRLTERLFQARVALVWAHLATNDQARASETMDEVIRSAGGRALPEGFGPEVERLYAAGLLALNGAEQARLIVDCKLPCEVLVNERPLAGVAGADEILSVGTYRVWVLAILDDVESVYQEVVVDSEVVGKVVFGIRRVADEPSPNGPRLRQPSSRRFAV